MPGQNVGVQLPANGNGAEALELPQNLKPFVETMQCPRPSQSQGDGIDAKTRFWATYTREATDHDGEFLEKYQSDMDIVLIFAGLFSAVNTSFIVNMQANLSPDPMNTTNVLLGMLLQAANPSFIPQSNLPYAPWQGPSTSVIWVQSLIYASLCASLLAALGAVLGKQWLSNFKRSSRGTIDDRGRQRQTKLDGLRTWHFDAVLQFLPSLLQISLLLFGVALSASMWTMSTTIATIIITSTTLGFTFYLTIVLASLMACGLPFPDTRINYPSCFGSKRRNFSKVCLSFVLYIPFKIIYTLNTISQQLTPSVFVAQQTDAPCIRWIIESSSDPDIITTAASFVPEVEWPPELDISTLLLQLFDTFLGCFENTHHEQLMLVPPRRERAIACGKAFLHLYLERKSFLNSEDSPFPVAVCEKDIRKLIWVHHSDQEISFICYLVFEVVLDRDSPTRLHQPNIPDAFLCWMSHPLLHRLNDLRYSSFWHERALDAIARILVNPLPPKNVLANCFIAGRMLLGQFTDRDAILKVTKSSTTALDILLEHIMKQESREQSAIVLRLLEPLGVVLELEEYRQIAQHRRVAEWGLEVCKTFVRTASQSQNAQDAIWNDARTVLHFTVIVAGDGPINQGDAGQAWQQGPSRLSIQEPVDCGWLIDYIIYYHNSNHIAVIDAMIALSQSPHVKFSSSRTPALVEVIVSSLGLEQLPALREAALGVAHACRKIIFADTYMPAQLFPDFSAALHSTLTYSDSPRQHLLCLKILYSCAKSEAWRAHMFGHGYHSSHLHIANTFPYPDVDPLSSEHLALYIIANLQVMQELSDHPLDLPDASSCQMLVQKAWHSQVVRQAGSLKETIEHLSAFTKDCLNEGMVLGTEDLVSSIRQTLGQLRLGSSDVRLTSAVNDLMLYITDSNG
ncbi:uncharacterized protein BJ212DRAFT_1518746 [Suillus subaureus]|uniref:DUF6535 domain-containing protein n=1 Tax=Suillus subaureus TaxID=48587 RepID=A0A9P7E6D9_9AGAM|nr:uncharacterized protein BJ212DRAFT_1518746 [Suillus subaureus]KAG1812414.1 hypothetical protein BJ212DRAFT_1518746 [Suillus subaureus]